MFLRNLETYGNYEQIAVGDGSLYVFGAGDWHAVAQDETEKNVYYKKT